jgi:hypothetical protein
MNAESKINIHYSSLVGLRAELLRKQTEVEAAKAKQENVKLINKVKIKDKPCNEKQKTKKLDEKKNSNEVEDRESVKALQKSKLMLQAKSRLYDKLSKTHTNLNPNFLVDFKHKPNDPDHIEDEDKKSDDDYKSDYDSDGEWIEYTDCFGRTRKCLPEDLPKMQEKDQSIRKKINNKAHENVTEQLLFVEDRLPNNEPEIEMMRKKWEEQTAKLSNKANIHYEDVLFDEARTHGVGYYAFSQDEEERMKQQENLFKLRKETEQKQKENQKIRDMKDKLQQNRLRVARLRQRIRAGLPVDETNETNETNETDENKSTNLLKLETNKEQNIETNTEKENKNEVRNEIEKCKEISETINYSSSNESDSSKQTNDCEAISKTNSCEQNSKHLTDKNKLADIENKIEAFGQLLGKRNRWYVMSQEEWVHKKRKERTSEFGPIYKNFENGESIDLNKIASNSDLKYSDSYSEGNDSTIVGPVPQFTDNFNVDLILAEDKTNITDSVSVSNQLNILENSPITEESNLPSSKGL